MKISVVVICLVGLLVVSMSDVCEAKLGLALAPFVWAGNLAKDASRTLVAYKLSLATKALAMITGNRSFKATISYDSRLERYEDAPAEVRNDGIVWGTLKNIAAVTPAPNPVHVENEVKVEWLPGVSKPVIRLPTLPKFGLPKYVVSKAVVSKVSVPALPRIEMPKLVVPKVPVPQLPRIEMPELVVPKVPVPQLPRIVVPRLVVPKIVMAEVAVPDVVQSKVDLLSSKINHGLNQLGRMSAGHLGGPKYASGYIQGGFRVGHGSGPVANVQVGSQAAPTPASTVATQSSVTESEQNVTTHSRPVRSIDEGVMGPYFRFIQANDEGRCVALMVCSMAAHPEEFGAYGRKVVDFFNDVHPPAFSPVAAYKEASSLGRSGNSCQSRYSACQVDPKYLAQLGESRAHL